MTRHYLLVFIIGWTCLTVARPSRAEAAPNPSGRRLRSADNLSRVDLMDDLDEMDAERISASYRAIVRKFVPSPGSPLRR